MNTYRYMPYVPIHTNTCNTYHCQYVHQYVPSWYIPIRTKIHAKIHTHTYQYMFTDSIRANTSIAHPWCVTVRSTRTALSITTVWWKACRLPHGQHLWLVSRKMLQEQPKMFWILCSFCRLPKFFALSFQIGYRRARSARFDKVKANLFGSGPMPSWFWFISLFEQFEEDLDE